MFLVLAFSLSLCQPRRLVARHAAAGRPVAERNCASARTGGVRRQSHSRTRRCTERVVDRAASFAASRHWRGRCQCDRAARLEGTACRSDGGPE